VLPADDDAALAVPALASGEAIKATPRAVRAALALKNLLPSLSSSPTFLAELMNDFPPPPLPPELHRGLADAEAITLLGRDAPRREPIREEKANIVEICFDAKRRVGSERRDIKKN